MSETSISTLQHLVQQYETILNDQAALASERNTDVMTLFPNHQLLQEVYSDFKQFVENENDLPLEKSEQPKIEEKDHPNALTSFAIDEWIW